VAARSKWSRIDALLRNRAFRERVYRGEKQLYSRHQGRPLPRRNVLATSLRECSLLPDSLAGLTVAPRISSLSKTPRLSPGNEPRSYSRTSALPWARCVRLTGRHPVAPSSPSRCSFTASRSLIAITLDIGALPRFATSTLGRSSLSRSTSADRHINLGQVVGVVGAVDISALSRFATSTLVPVSSPRHSPAQPPHQAHAESNNRDERVRQKSEPHPSPREDVNVSEFLVDTIGIRNEVPYVYYQWQY
jgi:hypothetical protein